MRHSRLREHNQTTELGSAVVGLSDRIFTDIALSSLMLRLVCKKLYTVQMAIASGLRRERHSVSDLKIHLVCVTKYRRKIFTSVTLELIHKSFVEVSKKMDFSVLEFNGESDHVHALIEFPPKLSISQIVNSLKGVSSRRYGQAGYPKPYGKDALWSPSYFVSTVGGAPLEVLKKYIQDQEKPSF